MFADKCMLATGEYLGNFNNPKWSACYLAVMRWKLILAVIVFEFSMLTMKDSFRNCDWTDRRTYFRTFIGFWEWKVDQPRVFVFWTGIKVKWFLDQSNGGLIVVIYHFFKLENGKKFDCLCFWLKSTVVHKFINAPKRTLIDFNTLSGKRSGKKLVFMGKSLNSEIKFWVKKYLRLFPSFLEFSCTIL